MATFDDYVDGTTALAEAMADSQIAQNRRIGAVEVAATALGQAQAENEGRLEALEDGTATVPPILDGGFA